LNKLLVLDSSGKSSGLFSKTLSSLGDYDQCLEIARHEIVGKYCSVDQFAVQRYRPTRFAKLEPGPEHAQKFWLGKLPNFVGMPFSTGLCVPATCSEDDVRELLSTGSCSVLI
jgi:hypothetical protein